MRRIAPWRAAGLRAGRGRRRHAAVARLHRQLDVQHHGYGGSYDCVIHERVQISGFETLGSGEASLYAELRGAVQVVQMAGLRRGYERP